MSAGLRPRFRISAPSLLSGEGLVRTSCSSTVARSHSSTLAAASRVRSARSFQYSAFSLATISC